MAPSSGDGAELWRCDAREANAVRTALRCGKNGSQFYSFSPRALVLTPQLFCKLRLRVAIASSREVVTHPPRPRRCPEVGETYLEAGPKPNHVVRTHSWHPNPRQSPGILQPSCSHLARAVLVCLRGASLHSHSCTKHMPARPMVRTNSP